ncbi:MAG: M20 family metallopeptidase [Deltaproteobacteria bacterium]|nr:M20 family metallopeptidase [Deltaproteobacteria bacterium]
MEAWLRHLRDYVAIPSVNPMQSGGAAPEIQGERRYAEHVAAQLRRIGLDAVVVGEGDRASVVAQATAAGATDTVLVASHLDTVPVDGMEIDPFDPRVEGGRLYGRGSCDTKSGMAAFVAALERVLASGRLTRNVVVVGEADEECGSVGVRDVLEHLGTKRPDWVLATEPTMMRLVTRHKGVARLELRASGVACHSSDPSRGRNAIVELSRAVLALDELAKELARKVDPWLGPPTLSVGVVGGGVGANVVPAEAWLLMDRRLLPGETAESITAEIRERLRRAGTEHVEITRTAVEKPPLLTEDDTRGARACRAALEAVGLPVDSTVAAFGTDAGVFAEKGLPGVVIGPGDIAQAHTAREFVELEQVAVATEFFTQLLRR